MSKEILREVTLSIAATEDGMQQQRMIPPEKDRMVRPNEAVIITGRSLASQHRDRVAGKWVPVYQIGDNSIGFLLSDLLVLNASRKIVTAENTRPVAPGSQRGRKPKVQDGGEQ